MEDTDDNDYHSASEENENDFTLLDKKDDKTRLIKMSFRDVIKYTTSWCFNRAINQEKVDELYNTLLEDYSIPWTLHAIYDDIIEDGKKIRILDGQHRIKAIESYITIDKTDRDVWIWLYDVKYSETLNSSYVINLFRKINNNRHFSEDELPNVFVSELVNLMCENNILKKGIGIKDANNVCYVPCIHKKELNTIFNQYKKLLRENKFETIIENMCKINQIIGLQTYQDLYGNNNTSKKQHDKAVSLNFFLNLGKKSKYPIDIWIKFINNPNELR